MDKETIIALVLLGIFANLFIFCFAVAHVRQRFNAKKKQRQWNERYHCKAQQRLENQRRIWSMYGLEYKGTLDDMRRSDDEDDSEDGDGRTGTSMAPRHGHQQSGQDSGSGVGDSATAERKIERGNNSSSGAHSEISPPPYTPGQWGRVRSAPSSPQAPQPPERSHDNRRGEDRNAHIQIASPRPQRLARFPLRPPEAVAWAPLRRSDTTRSTRRYSEPPVPTVDPEPSSVNGFNTDQGPNVTRSEPPAPMSPRRLDSISRRGWMEAVEEREPHAQ